MATRAFNVHIDNTVRIYATDEELEAWVASGMDFEDFFQDEAYSILRRSMAEFDGPRDDEAAAAIVFSDFSVDDVTEEVD